MQQLHIILIGLALFVFNNHTYTVWIPNGSVDDSFPKTVKQHVTFVAVGNDTPTSIGQRCTMQFTGIISSPPLHDDLVGRLPNLRQSDPDFTPDGQPLIDLKIDSGTLTAHRGEGTSINVEWTVDRDGPVTMTCDNVFSKTIPPDTSEVVIMTGPVSGPGSDDDFNFYRHLEKNDRGRTLVPKPPCLRPEPAIKITNQAITAQHVRPTALSATRAGSVLITPILACSPGTYP